eukprot:TRINITY_DN38335_c0_g1_i1.p1 TRINITY_DN38335_c0_g1~~TRINITY_DN38335_c0_g1_i1.p1  ORF type:complete len:1104 (-),score=166.63 TRINITY_DN38335_c0_g1_i1:293-3604(-)
MVTQSPLGRFFKPGVKRDAPDSGSSEAKKARGAPDSAAPVAAAAADPAPAPHAAEAAPEGAAAAVAATPAAPGLPPQTTVDKAPTDLRAALQQAQRAGSLPPFIAECFHHYETGGSPYSWPTWLQPANLKDLRELRPSDPGFDPGTLWVPSEKTQKEEGHGTPMLLQFWKVKSKHFDKIALFKVGKFYEVFYYDAFIAQHVCNLKWMSNEKKPHVGFPEMAKHDYAKKLVDAGYKVVVVEQVERVQENKQRKAETPQNGGAAGPSCIEREACEVFTKGTVVDPEMIGGASAKFMAYLHFEEQGGHNGASISMPGDLSFSVCLVDCATSQITLGRVADGSDRNALRTFLAQVQPSEVVYSLGNLPHEVAMLLRRLPCRPQQSSLKSQPSIMAARDRLARYRHAHPGKLPEHVDAILKSFESTTIAAAGALEYLEEVLLSSRILPFAVWEPIDLPSAPPAQSSQSTVDMPKTVSVSSLSKRMVLDATALSALEVLESLDGTYKGSLMEFLDHTSTPFGHRLLKQWLCAPLLDVSEIRSRQEVVEFFISNADLVESLRSGLRKIGEVDLERATSRVWGYALQAERHAVMYEDVTARRLRDFASLLRAYEQAQQLLETMPAGRPMPARLVQIVRTRNDGGSFPALKAVIDKLQKSVVTTPGRNDTVKYRPCDGADPAYDKLACEIKGTTDALETELKAVRAKLPGVPLAYVHRLPGFRYEIEGEEKTIPAAFLQKVDLTSRLKNKVRFQTPRIKELVAKLESLEDRLEDCIWPFLSRLFQEFYAHQAQFRAAARLVAELDALLALALASRGLPGASCVPEIVEPASPSASAGLELRGCLHPVAAAKLGAGFVPNDTVLGACDEPSVVVVTGPNMGGKSTVLRQTCVAVIMAQVGCRVCASKCRLSPVDRLFTRIGAYDTILEGKSTLLTELEETAAVLAHGTPRSLAVLDELGRGTSTFDGAAIAAAVLDDLARRVGCMALFATHYHPVSREAATYKEIAPYHMAASLDEHTQEMTFLYRFLPGLCPSSHGHNVARLAGLPTEVIEEARSKSAEFERGSSNVSGNGKNVPCGKCEGMAPEIWRLAAAGDAAALRSLFASNLTTQLGG